jgi:hypothetical protein
MKRYAYISKFALLAILLFSSRREAHAQGIDSMAQQLKGSDTILPKLNMDALYNRPFLALGKSGIALGGYAEAKTHYAVTDGIPDGFHFQMQRFTLFLSSTIHRKIKFLSELEFEGGTKEINIETALIDVEVHPLLVFRSGILMNPIGGFNQNHDGPRWDFVERPFVATEIIPSTWSNVGMGFWGKTFQGKWTLGYEAYLTNGLNERLILNENNRTSFASAKMDPDRFERSASGLPMWNAKIAIRNRDLGEAGISAVRGVYNTWRKNGIRVANPYAATLIALDLNTTLLNQKISLTGEWVQAFIEMPSNYIGNYGRKQMGGFLDLVGTVREGRCLGWDHTRINIGLRAEYVDYNRNRFANEGRRMAEDSWAITPTLAFRPTGSTVLRINYQYSEQQDLIGNPPARTGILLLGISSYF